MWLSRLHRTALIALTILVVHPDPARGLGLDGQRIVARTSIQLLPDPLAPLFSRRSAELEERVIEPDAVWPRDRDKRERRLWSRAALDVAADEQSHDARLAAAMEFPLDEASAKALYNRLNRRGGNGILPWAVERQFKLLVEAFRDKPVDDVVEAAGHLIHYAAKAADPFNATSNYDGKLTDNLHLGRVRLGHPEYAHKTAAERFSGELIRRNRARYSDMLGLSPGDYEPVSEPVGRTRTVMLASLSALDAILEADAETLELMQVTDGDALLGRVDEYYQLMDEKCGDLCVERLQHGAVFAANLVGGAWIAAGSPPAEEILSRSVEVEPEPEEQEAKPAAEREDPPPSKKKGAFVGSRHSNIYHFPHCKFAHQISPDNLVNFGSAKEAREDGRRPCRVCKPP